MAGTDRITGLLLEVDEALTTVPRRITGLLLEVDMNTAVCAIASIAPTSGPVGTVVTITGANFEAAQGAGGVTINGTPATVTAWAAGSITVTVAAGNTTGNVVVTTNGGQVSNPGYFTVTGAPVAATPAGVVPLGAPPVAAGAALLVYPPIRG